MQQLIHPQCCAQVFCRYANPHCQRPIQWRFCASTMPTFHSSPHNMQLITGPALQEHSQAVVPVVAWTDGGRQHSSHYPRGSGTTCGVPSPRQPKNTRNKHGALMPPSTDVVQILFSEGTARLDKSEGPELLRQKTLTILSRLYRHL